MAQIKISINNASSILTDEQVRVAVPALQTQVSRDFAPVWGVDAELTFVPQGGQQPQGHWWLTVLDNSDQAGALGYHDVTPDGLPLGKIFAGRIENSGRSGRSRRVMNCWKCSQTPRSI